MFGEVHLGCNFAREREQVIDRLSAYRSDVMGSEASLTQAVKPEYRAAFAYSANATSFRTTVGNRAELMADANETRRRMIADFDAATQRHGILGALISQAQHTLIISTPYFVPDYSLVNVLCATAYRGVDVTMIFLKHNDSIVVAATATTGNCSNLG